MRFSFVTWNILADAYVKKDRYPNSPPEALDPARRRALLLDSIVSLDADVYCLQEVEQASFDGIAARLSEHAGTLALKRGKPDGCATFVRRTLPVTRTAVHRFDAVEPGRNQLALLTEIDAGCRVAIACTHYPWQARNVPERDHLGRRQMAATLAALPGFAPDAHRWIIAGDFNSLSEGPVVREAMGLGMRLSCRSQRPWDTVNIGGRARKLDYALYTPDGLTPHPGRLPRLRRDKPMPGSEHASDHLPVRVEFEVT